MTVLVGPTPTVDHSRPAAGGALVTLCFAAATFLGAFLLFLVQPLIAKYILPWFGGGAAVWTTCMLFFQTTLLAGYLYAHLGVRRLRIGAQVGVHIAILIAAAAVALPAIVPSEQWKPTESGELHPITGILVLLAITIGLPCLALSATSPLLHAWYSRLRPGAAVYRLYALSNLGSLLALLAYPLVVEPLLPRKTQALAWSIAMAAFAILCVGCAVLAGRRGPQSAPDASEDEQISAQPIPTRRPKQLEFLRVLLWLVLPACASALLLATTNAITQDFAPVPLLWILPLTLYLLTFIIAFDRPQWYRRPIFAGALVAAMGGAIWILFHNQDNLHIALLVGGLLLPMFVGCMILHGELVRLRPPPAQLTSFYLMIAAGGALGGLLVAVGAPLLLNSYAELPAALWACCLLAFVAPMVEKGRLPQGVGAVMGIAAVMALAPVLWAAAHRTLANSRLLSSSRDFYGVVKIWEVNSQEGKGLLLHHGSITHGHQYLRASLRETPTTYYHANSGVGLALGEHSPLPSPRRVGVVGLGTGTVAAYGNAGDVYRFYEISPSVARIAQDPFTYLADLAARGGRWELALGDGRLSLEREENQHFDAIVLDAFSGDAIPVHLLTSEAFDLYQRHLKPTGILCLHVSNNYLDLQVVVAAAAKQLGWHAVVFESEQDDHARFPAIWVLVSPDSGRIDHLRKLGAVRSPRLKPGFEPWTDEHANVLRIIRR